MPVRSLAALVAVIAAAMLVPPHASADRRLGTGRLAGAALAADAGVVAWTTRNAQLAVQAESGDAAALWRAAPAHLDVGPTGRGGAQVVFGTGCRTSTGRCAVRSLRLDPATGELQSRVLASIGYRGGGAPPIAIDGRVLVYARRGHDGPARCDALYVERLGGTARTLAYGGCGEIRQLDLQGGTVAVLVRSKVAGHTQSAARVVVAGSGKVTTIEATHRSDIGGVALDAGTLYTDVRPPSGAAAFDRFSLASGQRRGVRAFVPLASPVAHDGTHLFYGQKLAVQGGFGHSATAYAVVEGDDPFVVSRRALIPTVGVRTTPAVVFADSRPVVNVSVTRRLVSTAGVVGRMPVAGARVQIAGVMPASAVTDATGTASFALPQPLASGTSLRVRAETGAGAVTTTARTGGVFVHMTATVERDAGGDVTLRGTIDPPLPGRKVRLDRRTARRCGPRLEPQPISPSTVDTPTGCVDEYTQNPVLTAPVSADGAGYALDAGRQPPGVYRIALNFVLGAAYDGATAPITVR